MGGLKLDSYFLNNHKRIKSYGKNTCVIDYVWDQVRGKKKDLKLNYDYEKLKNEIYGFVVEMPMVNTQELVNWAKSCHPNISIHAFDATYRKFLKHTTNHSNVTLVYAVKDHHFIPYYRFEMDPKT